MKVCYTALFGDYEDLKEPTVITPGWSYICFTDQPLKSNVWEIREVDTFGLGDDLQKLARYFKIMEWVDWEQSMWVDASFSIQVNLDWWWSQYFDKGFSVPIHPRRNCVYDEIDACVGTRGDIATLMEQRQEYQQRGIPKKDGIITSGIIMRDNRPEVIELCQKWWDELKTRSNRDQVAFAAIQNNFKHLINLYQWDYTRQTHFIYHKHYKYRTIHNSSMPLPRNIV